MTSTPRIYLDNAATSWPKPESVYLAVEQFQRQIGAPAGRSTYREAVEVERLVAAARRRVAELIGVPDPRRIVFTANGTDSLNLALHGLLRTGDHVVTSVVEHNSILRPLRYLETQARITVDRVPCDAIGLVDPDAIRRAIRPNTRLIALIHASNVTGAIQPIEAVGRIAREHGVLFLVDAAQTLGQIEFDVAAVGAHLVAAPGHKGLLGPLGTGILYIAPGLEGQLEPIRQGGTGTRSESDVQPDSLPDRYEAGNHNVLGIIGLAAGVAELQRCGVAQIRRHHEALTTRLLTGLSSLPGVTLYGPRDARRQVGVVSINVTGYDPQEVAGALDQAHRVQVRAGIHCAPRMHRSLGTESVGGTVRFSVGSFNTEAEIDTAIQAVDSFVRATGAGAAN